MAREKGGGDQRVLAGDGHAQAFEADREKNCPVAIRLDKLLDRRGHGASIGRKEPRPPAVTPIGPAMHLAASAGAACCAPRAGPRPWPASRSGSSTRARKKYGPCWIASVNRSKSAPGDVGVGVEPVTGGDVRLRLRGDEYHHRNGHRSLSAFSSARTSRPLRRGRLRSSRIRPGPGRTGEVAGPAQEAHRLLTVADHMQRAGHPGCLEGFPCHQHVPRIVLDQQDVDDPEPGRIGGTADLRHVPLPVTT